MQEKKDKLVHFTATKFCAKRDIQPDYNGNEKNRQLAFDKLA